MLYSFISELLSSNDFVSHGNIPISFTYTSIPTWLDWEQSSDRLTKKDGTGRELQSNIKRKLWDK